MLNYNKPIDEQREQERKIFFSNALLLLHDRQPIKARTWDISKKGMSVIISENLNANLICMIQFEIFIDIHNTHSFEIEAQITHCYFRSNSGFIIGLQFIRPPDRLKDTIAVFLNH